MPYEPTDFDMYSPVPGVAFGASNFGGTIFGAGAGEDEVPVTPVSEYGAGGGGGGSSIRRREKTRKDTVICLTVRQKNKPAWEIKTQDDLDTQDIAQIMHTLMRRKTSNLPAHTFVNLT